MRTTAAFVLVALLVPLGRADDDMVGNKKIKQLAVELRHADVRVRYQAMVVLYEAIAVPKQFVPELGRILVKDPHPVLRRGAAETIASLKEDAAPLTPALVAALRDSDPLVRQIAGQALMAIGEAAAEPLVKLLVEKDPATRLNVVVVIDGLGLKGKDVADGLGKLTKDPSAIVRRAAILSLAKFESEEVYGLLGEALRDKEQGIRQAAFSTLVGLGKGANPVLAKSTEDPGAATRLLAMHGLASLGENLDEKGMVALRKGLEDKDPRIRQTAATGIATQGARAREIGGDKEMFQALAKLMQDKDMTTRRAAILALGKIGSDDAEEIALAAEGLKDKDTWVRTMTVQTLAQFSTDKSGEATRKQLAAHLIDALRDSDQRVQLMAAQALVQELDHVVPPLTKIVEEGKGTQRLWAATILGELGGLSADAAPALQKMTRDANPLARQIAKTALQKIQ